MVRQLGEGTVRLAAAFDALARHDQQAATDAADEAVKLQRHLEHAYRTAMSALVDREDVREIAATAASFIVVSPARATASSTLPNASWYSVLKEA